jgi:hypothetical protein
LKRKIGERIETHGERDKKIKLYKHVRGIQIRIERL